MRVLLDTNIVLDVLLNRAPWVTESAAIWKAHDEGRIVGYVVATTITNVFYIARRAAGLDSAFGVVRICLDTFQICLVDHRALQQALARPGSDLEDNLQVACAVLSGLDAIVTRDKEGFRAATLPILTPPELLAQINSGNTGEAAREEKIGHQNPQSL